MKIGLIYMCENLTNGKVYIGQTSNFAKRLREHIRTSHQAHRREYHVPFHKAMREEGFHNFRWTILYSGIPGKYLDIMERWTIANFNSYENGYNDHKGGRTKGGQ